MEHQNGTPADRVHKRARVRREVKAVGEREVEAGGEREVEGGGSSWGEGGGSRWGEAANPDSRLVPWVSADSHGPESLEGQSQSGSVRKR